MKMQGSGVYYDLAVPVLVLKTSWNAIHYSGLGVVRSLGRLGIPVYSICEDRFTPTALSRYLAGAYLWNAGDGNCRQLIDDLEEIGRSFRRRAILIPLDDFGAVVVAENWQELGRWFLLPQNCGHLPRAVADKGKLARLCRDLHQPHPKTLEIKKRSDLDSFLKTSSYPLVMKRPQQWIGRGPTTRIIRNQEQLLAVYHEAEELGFSFLLQDYIPPFGRQDWFVHAYCDGNSNCIASFTGLKIRSNPPHAGATCLGESIDNSALRIQAESFLKKLGYKGIVDLDYRLDPRDGAYKLVDFNPRLGAQFRLFQDERGIDLVRALHLDLTGRLSEHQVRSVSRRFIVEDYDARASFRYLLAREISFAEWIRSLGEIDETAWFASDDMLPALVLFVRRLIRFIGISRRAHPRRAPIYMPGRFSAADPEHVAATPVGKLHRPWRKLWSSRFQDNDGGYTRRH
jgi:D-aspartate ligase